VGEASHIERQFDLLREEFNVRVDDSGSNGIELDVAPVEGA
jgi:hypothetical protein